MSATTLLRSRLLDIAASADLVSALGDNFDILAELLSMEVASYTAGSPTTAAGAPTTGTWVAKDLWRDVNGAVFYCKTGGTPGTWVQILDAHTEATPGSVSSGYVWRRVDQNGARFYWNGSAAVAVPAGVANLSDLPAAALETGLQFVIDGGGSAITTGLKGFLEVPTGMTITEVTALADQTGSIVVDLWKDTYANFPPTDADTITAGAEVTISAATKAQDSTLTGWTKTLAKGDVIGFNVDSVSTITRLVISIKGTRT